ncbi:unnamed protein product, partial [Mesorhabditis belari]|uniref:molybdopterin molybdotransferase n=1 Tax=Mesorhabditis belari TaxID=2138241 RepID=A0AAF3EY54_9BILA
MRFSIITVSDSCSNGTAVDKSGPLLVELIRESEKLKEAPQVSGPHLIPDEKEEIVKILRSLCGECDVIITTGGTGWAPRDVTPEATNEVIERRCGGLETAIHVRSLQITPFAALSRLSAGIFQKTLIVNFPGSAKAVKECWEVLETVVDHGVSLLIEADQSQVHKKIQSS